MDSLWVVGLVALLVALLAAAHWFFFYTGPGEGPDHAKIRGYRQWKAQATSYSEMLEWRDAIEQEYETAGRKGETPWQRLRRWWRKS